MNELLEVLRVQGARIGLKINVKKTFQGVFQINCLRNILGIRLTDRISNSRLYEKCGSIPLSKAIMRQRLRWLGYVLWMKDDRLPKIVLFNESSWTKREADRPPLGWEDVIKKDLK
ncbi:uncharacterized protein LOC136029747 [Artemia franciscana]|uniref:uncharacterized protein LOC136029747 n=1 Tax=Artemia franciscana TaxID=6661 RepID=UPI0032D9FE44